MHLLEDLDNLIEYSKNQIEFFKENINKKSKFKKELNVVDDECKLILKEIDDIISENLYVNLIIEGDVNNDLPDKNNINNKKSFYNYNNSCSFDCFISIFIFYILPIINKIKESSKNLIYNESDNETKYNLYLKIIDFVINSFDNDFIFF